MSATVRYLEEIEGSDVPNVPEGNYTATLQGVERTTTKFGEALRWHWLILQASGEPFELTQMTSTATTGGSNAGRNIRALLGRTLSPGEKLSKSAIYGKSVTLELSINPESGWNRVEGAYPTPQPTAPARPVNTAPLGSAEHMQNRLAGAVDPRLEARPAAQAVQDELSF